MENLGRKIGLPAAAAALMFTAVILPEVAALRYIVGDNKGWSANVNYTEWAHDKRFYNGDWLFFVYNRHLMSVLEVNKTDYDNCFSDRPLKNWTLGAGRDIVPLNVIKTYYFISGNGFCHRGMKFAIHVQNPLTTSSYRRESDLRKGMQFDIHAENPPSSWYGEDDKSPNLPSINNKIDMILKFVEEYKLNLSKKIEIFIDMIWDLGNIYDH